MEWEAYCKQNDAPEDCPICSKPSSLGSKLAPFCCTAHRNQHERQKQREYDAYYADTAPMKGEHVRIGDLVHVVKWAPRTGPYQEHSVVCGLRVLGPRVTKELVTCLICLARR